LERAARRIGQSLAVVQANLDPSAVLQYWGELGIAFPPDVLSGGVPSALTNAVTALGTLTSQNAAIDQAAAGTDSNQVTSAAASLLADLPGVLVALDQLGAAISALGGNVPGVSSDRVVAFGQNLRNTILQDALLREFEVDHPDATAGLLIAGLVERVIVAGDPTDPTSPSFVQRTIRLDRLGDLLRDPGNALVGTLGWGSPNPDYNAIEQRISGLLTLFGFRAAVQTDSTGDPSLTSSILGVQANRSTSPPGLDLTINFDIPDGLDLTFNVRPELAIGVTAQGDIQAGFVITATPPAHVSIAASASATANLAANATLGPVAPDTELVLIGQTGGTRIAVGSIKLTVGVTLTASTAGITGDPFVSLAIVAGHIVVDPSSADGFIQSLTGGASFDGQIDVAAEYSASKGLVFKGGGLEVDLPLDITFLGIHISGLSIRVAPTSGGAIEAQFATSISATLGPVDVAVDKLGLTTDISFPSGGGSLGFVDLSEKFKPPTGLGIEVDAGPVSGGGFISFDEPNGRYFGALELSVYSISVKAFGIIETKFPDGHTGFSFLIIISAEFVPIQLGLGFTLLGVGGLAGINRSINTDGLIAAVKKGDLDNVLFPHDVVDNAPAILHDLETIFPPTDGHYVFGPMAKIGWGTPTLVDAELGIVIELPGPVLAVLGTVHAAIPTADAALVELNLDVAGILDFPKKFFSLDASLHDSRVGDFPVSGDMAMRMYWGQNPSFAIAIGGFNKHYNPPAGFPTLRRVSVDLGENGNPSINLSGYLALTSNTFQTGALLEARVSGGGAELYGFLGFDAIFVFSPFSFEADIEGGVGVKFHGAGFSLQFHGTISGPSPWHLDGQVCVSILFWDACVGFSVSLGGESKPTLPGLDPWTGSDIKADGTQDVPGLQPALQNPANWGGNPDTGSFAVVTLVPAVPGTSPPVDPLGSATVRQKAVPLDLAITKFAGTKPSVSRTFDVQSVTIGQAGQTGSTTVSEPARVSDFFAPAQYQDMKDADKLSSPSFVQLAAGFTISSDAVSVGTSASVGLTYDTILFGPGGTETDFSQQFNPSQAHVTSVTARSAVALGGIRNAAQARFVDPTAPAKVTLTNELYVLAQISTLQVAGGFSLATAVPRPVATAALLAAAAASATALQTLQVTPVWGARA
jgi:hypothetical protein